jgi:molybdopterin converting factor small subunit
MAVTVRLFAAAREAVGAAAVEVAAGSLDEVAAALGAGDHVRRVLRMSTWLVDGTRYPVDAPVLLPDGAVVDVLPPFAGG